MLFKGNSRGGAANLAAHLLNDRDNDHVDVHQVRGFASTNLKSAFREIEALSKGTKCINYLYSLSINPPPMEEPSTADFLDAIKKAEKALGLAGQPRVIVFHEKEGRRHAHAVWSRIDATRMRAISDSNDHPKLQSVSRDLFIEHGWDMPKGMMDRAQRDPTNFTLAEWQQAKRNGTDPRKIKAAIQDAWASSDTKAAFAHALEERGYVLAKGDRKGFVAVDAAGEVYAIAKWVGVKAKDVRAKLGVPDDLPSVTQGHEKAAGPIAKQLNALRADTVAARRDLSRTLQHEKQKLITKHRQDRQRVFEQLENRRISETKIRAARLRSGLSGLWDRLRGHYSRQQKLNKAEALQCQGRDQRQKDSLITNQLSERKAFDQYAKGRLAPLRDTSRGLREDVRRYSVRTSAPVEDRAGPKADRQSPPRLER